ncbi:hypothetical protein BH24ACT5_BH24ACT5_08900 [soil metagenome]
MRVLPMAGLAVVLLAPAGAAVASVPPSLPEPPADSVSVPEVSMAPPDTSDVADEGTGVHYVDESGDVLATIVVESAEPTWTGFAEGDEPDSGKEYLRVVVTVQSEGARDTFSINVDDFILQDVDGFLYDAQSIKTAEESEADADVTTEADLANGESVELALTFEAVAGVNPLRVFYQPSDDRLVDVATLS